MEITTTYLNNNNSIETDIADESDAAVDAVESESDSNSEEEPKSKCQEENAEVEESSEIKTESAKLRELARREKKAMEREQMAKQKLQEIEDKINELRSFNEVKEQVKSNPLKALEHLGVDFNTLANAVINSDKPESLEQRLERLERERQADIKRQEQREKEISERQQQEAIQNFKKSVINTVQKNNESYELINLTDNHDLVYDVIYQNYCKTGKIIDIEVAAAEVEDYLTETYTNYLNKSNKLKAKLGSGSSGTIKKSGAIKNSTSVSSIKNPTLLRKLNEEKNQESEQELSELDEINQIIRKIKRNK